jgi:hypothetical protein
VGFQQGPDLRGDLGYALPGCYDRMSSKRHEEVVEATGNFRSTAHYERQSGLMPVSLSSPTLRSKGTEDHPFFCCAFRECRTQGGKGRQNRFSRPDAFVLDLL